MATLSNSKLHRRKGKGRRFGVAAALALSVSLVVSACGSPSTQDNTDGESALQAAMGRSATWVITSSGPGVVENGRSMGFTVEKLPTVIAAARMQEQGWNVEARFLDSNENVVQSAVQGDSDVINLALPSVLAAVSGQVPLHVFAAGTRFAFVIVGDSSITGPADLDGKRIAYQATVSAGTLAARLWALGADVEPQFLTMPGSAARAEALLAGQIDAAAVSAGFDAVLAEEGAPGQFTVLFDPVEKYPFLLDTVLAYNGELDPQKRAFLEVFLAEQIKVVEELNEDRALLQEMLDEYDIAVYPPFEVLSNLFFDEIGVSATNVDQQVDLMLKTEQIDSSNDLPKGADLIDTTIWDNISKSAG